MIHFSVLPTEPDENSPVLSNPSLQTSYEGSAVCRELKCHFPHVPFHRSRRWPVRDPVYRAGLTENYLFFLMGLSWHFFINFDLTHRGPNLSIKERWESVWQVLTNYKWQISRMLQDMLNSCGIQFYCFNLKRSMRTRSQKIFFPSPEKCFWSLTMPWLRATPPQVEKVDKATTQALPHSHGIHYLCVLLHKLCLKYGRNGLGMKMAWRKVLRHRASFPFHI